MKSVLGEGVDVCLIDILGYAETERTLLHKLEVVKQTCRDFGFQLHPEKCIFVSYTV